MHPPTQLNYHHLRLFHAVVREGGVAAAGRQAGLTAGTVSVQIKALEKWAGGPLLERRGRHMQPTELGSMVFEYADSMFEAGRELASAVRFHASHRRPRVVVGVVHTLARHAAMALLRPLWSAALAGAGKSTRRAGEDSAAASGNLLVVRLGRLESLLKELAVFHLDLILSDEPVPAGTLIRTLSHPLPLPADAGKPGGARHDLAVLAPQAMAAALARDFPRSLHAAPAVLPTTDSPTRRALDAWLSAQDIAPTVVAECQDPTLCKMLSQRGVGFTVVHSFAADEVMASFGLQRVGHLPHVAQPIYLIEAHRRRTHPLVQTLIDHAISRRRRARSPRA